MLSTLGRGLAPMANYKPVPFHLFNFASTMPSEVTFLRNSQSTYLGANDKKSAEITMSLYDGIEAPRIKTELKIAEGVKYADNSWHAMKIGFANELGNILSNCGVDSHKVMDIFCQDEKLNISKAYLKPGFAFGGSCLPKDVRAIRALGQEMGVKTTLFDSLLIANDNQIERAFNDILKTEIKNIILLGLSFKANTDDLRESPLLTLAEKMIQSGINLKIYDPIVSKSYNVNSSKIVTKNHFIDNESLAADMYVIGNNSSEFLDIIRNNKKPGTQILDLVRISSDIENEEGYRGICW